MVRKKNILHSPTRAAKAGQKYLYRHDKPDKPTKDGPLSFVLFESPFTSVSTVSRDHPSLVSLRYTVKQFYKVRKIYIISIIKQKDLFSTIFSLLILGVIGSVQCTVYKPAF